MATEEFQEDGLFGIDVFDGFDEFADGDFDAEFFHEFTLEAGFEGFFGVALAAREFPKTAEMRVRVAPSDEKFA